MPVTPLNGSTATSEMNYQTQGLHTVGSESRAAKRSSCDGKDIDLPGLSAGELLVNFESAIIICELPQLAHWGGLGSARWWALHRRDEAYADSHIIPLRLPPSADSCEMKR